MSFKLSFLPFAFFLWSIGLLQAQPIYDTIAFVPHTSVKDQHMSGTCWSFATTSFIESELMRKGYGKFDLSEMFFVFHSLHAKTETHVRMQGNNYFTPGGQMHDVMNVIRLHGLMTESGWGGYTTRDYSHNHAKLDTALAVYMRRIGHLRHPVLPSDWKSVCDSIIAKDLGSPPLTFPYNNQLYTPLAFRDKLGFNPDQYITITSYSHHPYQSFFVLEDRFNWASGLYYNLPPDVFEQVVDSALIKGYSVVWDGDVSEKTFNAESGTAIINAADSISIEAERQRMFDDHQTTVDHVMHVIGILKKFNGEKYYVIKNSWGEYGKKKGYILMNRNYFLLKTVAVMVHVDAMKTH